MPQVLVVTRQTQVFVLLAVDIKTGSDGKAPEKTLASVEAAQQESSKKVTSSGFHAACKFGKHQ